MDISSCIETERRPLSGWERMSSGLSSSLDCRREHVAVVAIVVAPLKFIHIEREIFLADFVERADDAALHDGPESLNGVRMNSTDYILILLVHHNAMRPTLVQVVVDFGFVRRNQADSVRHGLFDERLHRAPVGMLDYSRNDVSFAGH